MPHRRQILALLAALAAAPRVAAMDDGFSFASIDGGRIELADWRGKPVLVVNTASMCAYTPQYDALQALHDELGDRALILAVPSDDFGGQEYGTEAEVKEFCEINFDLTLPMTEITRVRGTDAHPFYAWAAAQGVARAGTSTRSFSTGKAGSSRTSRPRSARPTPPCAMHWTR